MEKIKIEIDLKEYPLKVRELMENANIYDSSCHSSSKVYYIDKGYYIKIDSLYTLKNEARLTRLMHELGFGVELIDYISEGMDYLVTREAIGDDLTHVLENPEKLCQILANALKKLHEQPIKNFPISSKYQRYFELLENEFKSTYYDEGVLMNRYMIHSRAEALEIIKSNYRELLPDTLIHGDSCLPNIIQNDNEFCSFIDFSMTGAGSKYIDLYWAIWSLNYNLKTEEYTDLFLNFYGKDNVDEKILKVVAAFELLV